RRGEEGAGGQADVDVEVGRLAIDEEVVEGLQAAELVGAARDRAPRQDERNARVALAGCEVTLVDDRETHGGLTPAGCLAARLDGGALRHPQRDVEQCSCHTPPSPASQFGRRAYTSVTTCEIVESTKYRGPPGRRRRPLIRVPFLAQMPVQKENGDRVS